MEDALHEEEFAQSEEYMLLLLLGEEEGEWPELARAEEALKEELCSLLARGQEPEAPPRVPPSRARRVSFGTVTFHSRGAMEEEEGHEEDVSGQESTPVEALHARLELARERNTKAFRRIRKLRARIRAIKQSQ